METPNIEIYLVSWSGGYEAPSYQAFDNETKAWEIAHEWAEMMAEGEDQIDVLKITLPDMNVVRLEASQYGNT